MSIDFAVSEVVKGLSIDSWYKALLCIGGGVLIVALFVPVHGITNGELEFLSSGAFFVGLGEWKNQKTESFIKPANAYTGPAALISRTYRHPDVLGVLFDIAGVCLFVYGIWRIIWRMHHG